MPFGQAGVEPALIVSEAVLPSWDWVLVGMVRRSGQGWVWAWPAFPTPSQTLLFRRAWELQDRKVIGYV